MIVGACWPSGSVTTRASSLTCQFARTPSRERYGQRTGRQPESSQPLGSRRVGSLTVIPPWAAGHGRSRPTAGTIRVGEVEVTELRGAALTEYRRHRVGVVFQTFNLVPSLTARDNVQAPLWAARMPARQARARAEPPQTPFAEPPPRNGSYPDSTPLAGSGPSQEPNQKATSSASSARSAPPPSGRTMRKASREHAINWASDSVGQPLIIRLIIQSILLYRSGAV